MEQDISEPFFLLHLLIWSCWFAILHNLFILCLFLYFHHHLNKYQTISSNTSKGLQQMTFVCVLIIDQLLHHFNIGHVSQFHYRVPPHNLN